MDKSQRWSRGANRGGGCYHVNDECHGWVGPVPRNEGHAMATPEVYAIYWDEYFRQYSAAVNLMNQFFREIQRGSFMCGLSQYGVGEGVFRGHSVIVPDPPPPQPPRPPLKLTPEMIETQLRTWIDKETEGTPRPDPDNTNLLYVIFAPNNTDIGECVCGYHRSGRFDTPLERDNLFWAAIQEWHHDPEHLPSTDREFVDSCSWCVSHEMVEAFTNRDGKGYHTANGCEIGDICESAKGSPAIKTPIIKVQVDGWWVETYWDNINRSCYPLHIVPQETPPTGPYEIVNEKRRQRGLVGA